METIGYIILGVFVLIFAIGIVLWILRRMKGSIEIVPEKYSYSSGETIKGKLTLKLKKPVSADKLIVGLKCEKKERSYSRGTRGSNQRTSTVFDFNQPLDGKKEYAPSEYPYDFSISIPNNVSQKLEGMAATIVKTAQILTGQNSSMRWYLYAELQCEGVNLSKQVQVNVV